MSISRTALILNSLMILVVLSVAGTGVFAIRELVDQIQVNSTLGIALRNHMRGDMMHDAIMGDVLRASKAVLEKNSSEIANAKIEIEEHGKTFVEALTANQSSDLPSEIRKTVDSIRPKLESYIASGSQLVARASVEQRLDDEEYKSFTSAFKEMETAQEEVSQLLQSQITRSQEDTSRKSKDLILAMMGVAVVGMLAAAANAGLTYIRVSRPIAETTRLLLRLANGERNLTLVRSARRDEIGDMQRGLLVFQQNAEQIESMQAERDEAERLAREAEEKLRSDVSVVVHAVSSAATELYSCADNLTAISAATTEQAIKVSESMNSVANSSESIASASEQMSSSVDSICKQVADTSTATTNVAERVKSTIEVMDGLATAAHKINSVVELIRDIAWQTNLLSLNASIEAARAGEAGKGFAVVAQSVKQLADQTAAATTSIKEEVDSIQHFTTLSVEAIGVIRKLMDEVSGTSQATAATLEEQSASTQLIATNLDQLSKSAESSSGGVNELKLATQTVGTAASELQSAARELSVKSEQMREIVESFARTGHRSREHAADV